MSVRMKEMADTAENSISPKLCPLVGLGLEIGRRHSFTQNQACQANKERSEAYIVNTEYL